MKTIENNRYIESQNIKVFPCAYRGYYSTVGTTETYVFDPEARATTESNFTNTFHKISTNKKSYVISWDDNQKILKFVIDGYYFEIYDHEISEFFYLDNDEWRSYNFCIKTNEETLAASDKDRERTTQILSSFANTDAYLDIKNGTNESATYVFTGLVLKTNSELSAPNIAITAHLQPFLSEYAFSKIGTVSEENTQINNYYLDENGTYIKITDSAPAEIGIDAYSRTVKYKVNPVELPITSLLDVAEGQYSLRMIGEVTDSGNNNTVAEGDYAVALGKHTKANGLASIALGDNSEAIEDHAVAIGNNVKASGLSSVALGDAVEAVGNYSTALGKNTKTQGNYALAIGNNAEAKVDGAIALGQHTKANAANQVVIGKYNAEDAGQAFIIANGSSSTDTQANKFTVSKIGNVRALGNLEVKGSIKATEVGTKEAVAINNLELGTQNAYSTGSIKIYGASASETPVFQVTTTGNTTIADNTHITKDTDYIYTSATNSINAALKVDGGAHIGKKLNVVGNTTIAGITTLNNNLIVAKDKDTSLGGTLAVAKDTTLNGNLEISGTNTAKIGGDLTVDGTTSLNDNLTVASSKTTTLGGLVSITDETDVSDTSAALSIAGGAKISKQLAVGGDTKISGAICVDSSTESTSTSTGALVLKGGLGVNSNTNIGGQIFGNKDLKLFGGTDSHLLEIGHKNETDNKDKSGGILRSFTTAGNIGFEVNDAGRGKIYSSLTINSNDTDLSSTPDTALVVNGKTIVQGAINATSLKLTTNSNAEGYGNIEAKNIDATNLISAKSLKIASGQNQLELNTDNFKSIASKIILQHPNQNSQLILTEDGITTLGNTKLSNKVNIDTNGDISGVNTLVATSTIKARTFNATSDFRKKTNISEYSCKKSILDLPIKSFEYLDDKNHSKYIGCIAQDLQEICPEIVNADKDGFLTIQENKLVYLLLQEVKALKKQIEKLERR